MSENDEEAMMTDLLFDPPWYLPVLLAGLALFLLYQGLISKRNPPKFAGLIAAALAAAWLMAASLVETGKEVALRQTQEFAAALDRRDWVKFKSLLDPKAQFAIFANRDEFVAGAKATVEKRDVKDVTLSSMDVKEEPGGYNVTFTATASISEMDSRPPTNWKFLWLKDDSGKELLYRIEALPSIATGADQVISRLVKK